MTPERLAQLKDRWSGGGYEELFAEMDRLLTALREAQEEARVHESNKDTAVEEWARVERERDALQQRAAALEAAALFVTDMYGKLKAALRGEEAG